MAFLSPNPPKPVSLAGLTGVQWASHLLRPQKEMRHAPLAFSLFLYTLFFFFSLNQKKASSGAARDVTSKHQMEGMWRKSHSHHACHHQIRHGLKSSQTPRQGCDKSPFRIYVN